MLQIGVISISLIFTVGAGANLTSAIVSAASEIGFTFWVGLTTGLMCLPVAFAAAKELLRSGARGRTWWFLVTVPLAVPAPLIGIGLISIWNQSFWIGLYGTAMMPVLATLARFTPMAALVLLAQLRQIDPLLVDAARVFQTSSLHAWLRVRLPLLAPGVLAAAAIVFALSIGELGATLIVAPPGQATLTMRIYNYLHYGSSSVVAGLCLMMVALTLAVGILAILALASWSRISEEQT
jgi:iron(III) transport system permease protein